MHLIKKGMKSYKEMPITAKATLWFLICNIMQKGISLITVPIFTRMLSQEQYGQYSAYLSWLQIFTIICTFRLDFAVFNKAMSKFKMQRDRYTSAMQGLTSCLTLACFCVYLVFSKQINTLTELPTFIMIGIFCEIFFHAAFSFWSLRKRYEYHYRDVVFVTLLLSVLNPIIGVCAVTLSQNKGFARIVSCILVQASFGLVFYLINLYKGKKLVDLSFWKYALLFNIPLIPHYFSSYIIEHSDRIMIQKMCGLTFVALYSIAYNVGALVKIVTTSVNNAIIPWLYTQMEKKNFQAIEKQSIVMLGAIGVVVLGFILFAPELVYILAGEDYYDAIYVIPAVSVSSFFVFAYGILANIEFFYDLNKFTMYITAVGAILNLVLNFVMLPVFGYTAAAYTSLFSYIVAFAGHYIFVRHIVRKRANVDIFSSNIYKMLLVGLVLSCFAALFLYQSTIIRYIFLSGLLLISVLKRKYIMSVLKTIKRK